jgi:hypothetical protein
MTALLDRVEARPGHGKRSPGEQSGMMRRVTDKIVENWIGAGNVEDLALLVERRRALDEQIEATARAYHAEGHSWTEIGKALGITRQSARERFGRDES